MSEMNSNPQAEAQSSLDPMTPAERGGHVRQMPPSTEPNKDRVWPMLCHLAAFASFIFPFGHIIGPLIVWLAKREDDPEVRLHGRESLNFQITITLLGLVLAGVGIVIALTLAGALSTSVGPGAIGFKELLLVTWIPLFIVLFVIVLGGLALFSFILIIINSIRAYDGKEPSYWPRIRFLK